MPEKLQTRKSVGHLERKRSTLFDSANTSRIIARSSHCNTGILIGNVESILHVLKGKGRTATSAR